MQPFGVQLTLLVALIIPLISAQLTQSPSNDSKLFRFVAQLNVNGCAIFVHDTGEQDGPHLAVEPIMCVTESLHDVFPQYDQLTNQIYVSVPVMLTDGGMLAEVQRQLRHLSPKSVNFAAVTDISVSDVASSEIHGLGLDWTPDEAVGYLRLGCSVNYNTSCLRKMIQLKNVTRQQENKEQDTNCILLAKFFFNGFSETLPYLVTIQNRSLFDISVMSQRYMAPPTCKHLRFVRSIRLNQCTARVHQRFDSKGHFLIEPLLCHSINNMSAESVVFDYIRDMYYLKLDVVLQDEITLNAVRSQLADLSPLSVSFMRVWSAQSHVASALKGRFEIGRLMVSGDGRSGQVGVYCRSEDDCNILRHKVTAQPFSLLKHIKWTLSALVDSKCLLTLTESRYIGIRPTDKYDVSSTFCEKNSNVLKRCVTDGRFGVIIQQRITGRVSFQRSWSEYVNGFGDSTDFWIGLADIHSLSINGVTLRVEMKLWNGTELHAEYAGFKVGNASTNYTMTFREMLSNRSNVRFNALRNNNGRPFFTKDRDSSFTCSKLFGEGGWWFGACHTFNPNGIFPASNTQDGEHVVWHSGSEWLSLKEVRLILVS